MKGNRKAKLPTPSVGCVTGSSAAERRPRKFCVPPKGRYLMSAGSAKKKRRLLAQGTCEVSRNERKGW